MTRGSSGSLRPGRPAPLSAFLLPAALLLILPLTGPGTSRASEGQGTIAGTVSDARGEPIIGADMQLTGARGGVRTCRTDERGAFRFPAIATETLYSLSAGSSGFRSVVYEGLGIENGRTRTIDVRLKRPGDRDAVVLLSRDPYPFQDLLRSFLEGLDVPVRVLDLDADPAPEETVRRVRAERPNLILGTGLLAARLVRREIRDIPAILTLISDPRRYDLEAENLCFVATNPSPEEMVKRIRAFVPQARVLGLVYDAQASQLVARDISRAARQAGLKVLARPCYSPRDLDGELASLAGKIDVLTVPFDPLTIEEPALDQVARWALQQRVPLAAPGPEWVRRGALFSYGATPESIGSDVSYLATQILSAGRQPSDIRYRFPTVPHLAVNQTTADALGISVPAGMTPDITY